MIPSPDWIKIAVYTEAFRNGANACVSRTALPESRGLVGPIRLAGAFLRVGFMETES
jgi:hypothetical protein